MPKAKTERVNTIQEVRADVNPQLCKTYNPAKHKWNKQWLAEPKFDGLRCIVIVENKVARAYSRNGKPLWNMDNILDEIMTQDLDNYVLDGEVYTKNLNLSLGIVKRSTQNHPDQDDLRYHIWDLLTIKEWKSTWTDNKDDTHKVYSSVSNLDRKKRLDPLFDLEYTEIVYGVPVSNEEEFQNAYKEFLVGGFEGAVLKDPSGPYQGGRRSPYWLKIKPWSDADLNVVGAYAGEGKHLGRIGGLILEGECEWQGKTYQVRTEVGTGFTDAEREFFQGLWDSQSLVGRVVEIKFQDVTVEDACRFPVYHRLREDKE